MKGGSCGYYSKKDNGQDTARQTLYTSATKGNEALIPDVERSAAGRKYERMKANPAAYKRHLMERITKIRGWIARLRTSKDPLKSRKIANHNIRIKSIQATLKDL